MAPKTNQGVRPTLAPKTVSTYAPGALPAVHKDLFGDDEEEITHTPQEQSLIQIPIQRRNMTGKTKVFTDLFKLLLAPVLKYEGWNEKEEYPDTHPSKFSKWEHTHPFRTYDKKGSRLTTSTPIAGHFHVIEWEAQANGVPKVKSVSGPMVMSKSRTRGQLISKPVQANDYDYHTHEIEYLRSAEIEFSTTNVEAARVIAAEAAKLTPPVGVNAGGERISGM